MTNESGDYISPPHKGFKSDCKKKSTAKYYILPRGVYLDHFGSEWGKSHFKPGFFALWLTPKQITFSIQP